MEVVVIGNVLFGCSRNGIVVLVNAQSIQHLVLDGQNLLLGISRGLLIEEGTGKELLGCVESGLSISDLLLGVSSAGVVAAPEVLSLISIGEHVVVSHRPGYLLIL